jgi:alkaline phosphatase
LARAAGCNNSVADKNYTTIPFGIAALLGQFFKSESLMRRIIPVVSLAFLALSSAMAFAQNNQPRNLILFVPDGLRALKVTPETAPSMAEIRDKGVNFKNSHSLFPTFTMANASGMSTGHYLGDTGTFSNSIYTGHPVAAQNGSVVPFLEHDQVLRDVDEQFGGDYLDEETLLKAARQAGFSTAAIGKLGPSPSTTRPAQRRRTAR